MKEKLKAFDIAQERMSPNTSGGKERSSDIHFEPVRIRL